MLEKVDGCNQNFQINFSWVLQIAKLATVVSVWNKILLPILAEKNIFFQWGNLNQG